MERKIDIYTRARFAQRGTKIVWEYECSTMSKRTCKAVKADFCNRHGLSADQVKACYSEPSQNLKHF